MDGKVTYFNDERKFGFIRSKETTDEYWFHLSYVNAGAEIIEVETSVSFDPITTTDGKFQARNISVVSVGKKGRRTDFTPDYAGPKVILDEHNLTSCLHEISQWKLEAKLEDVVRYFCPVPKMEAIYKGRISYVIGRKGTGKTAIAQHIYDTSSDSNEFHAEKLSFKNFPFNELYELENHSYTRPNQYITIWKYIVYSYVVRQMAKSTSLDPLTRKKIQKVYPEPDSSSLRNLLQKWTSGDFSISILGNGFSFMNWFRKDNPTSWQERVEHLEEFIKSQCDASVYLILFDELDEDYKEMLTQYESGGYIDLVTSLFKAVQDIRSVMSKSGKNVYPVIFLRDDIFSLLMDADKNKWRDLTAYLDWDTSEIQRLLRHRISKAAGTDNGSFDEIWYSIFDEKSVPYAGKRKSLHSFDYITRSTQGRPRDYIHYLQVCAQNQLDLGGGRITAPTVQSADKAYSNYLKTELIDEIHGIVPDIQEVFRLFTQIRKWIMPIGEFTDMFNQYLDRGVIKTKDPEFVLQTLFYFSVIGNVSRQHQVHIFRHENPEAVLNFHENIVIHRGLMKALQIF